jgi:Photosynthetic reaction centre cytochrome C subunit
MRRALSVSAVLTFLASTSLALLAQKPPSGASQPHSMPAPTNLQVLPKDISPSELMKLMGGYSKALGVHCNFCHEVNGQTRQPNFAADTKPDKNIARTMIAMTEEINSKFMTQINDPDAKPEDRTVTCGTCHRGNTMPVQFIPKTEKAPGSMPMQKPQ